MLLNKPHTEKEVKAKLGLNHQAWQARYQQLGVKKEILGMGHIQSSDYGILILLGSMVFVYNMFNLSDRNPCGIQAICNSPDSGEEFVMMSS